MTFFSYNSTGYLSRKFDLGGFKFRNLIWYLVYLIRKALNLENSRIPNQILKTKSITNSVANSSKIETRNLLLPEEVNPLDSALDCLNANGFYPVSFATFETMEFGVNSSRKKLLSSIVPGIPYSFDFEEEYYAEYMQSEYAFTFKKCGWDSFRNLEIISRGCIPLYLDAKGIPRYTMTFYPKRSMALIAEEFRKKPFKLSAESKDSFRKMCKSRLEYGYLYSYLNELIILDSKEILFIDDSLDLRPDYLSLMLLNALAKEHKQKLFITKSYNYFFTDNTYESEEFLYGRGFGYRGRLRGHNKYVNVLEGKDISQFSGIIFFGNVHRNWEKFIEISDTYGGPIVSVWGEDIAPSRSQLREIQARSSHVFVRELNHPFVIP